MIKQSAFHNALARYFIEHWKESFGTLDDVRELSEISRWGGRVGGNLKFGFGNEVTHPCNGSEIC